jgi:FKBP-type peptidyl-prolyl cis-trans isomerase FkpA
MLRTRLPASLLLALFTCTPMAVLAADPPTPVPTDEELQRLVIRDTRIGTGTAAKAGDEIVVNYTGWVYGPTMPQLHGNQFDSSVGGPPFEFTLGVGSVIIGWDRGIVGMKEGGKRTLIIPPSQAYGQRGSPPSIPPFATLVFDVELVKVR